MTIALDAALVVASFFVGAIPFGLVVSRLFFRRDLRAEGSGNIGAANALRTLGKGGAIAVLVLDALKGALPVIAGRVLGGETLALTAAFAAILGHCFSPFLNFRGGKGVATNLGAVLALAWPAGGIFAVIWLAGRSGHRLLVGRLAPGQRRDGARPVVVGWSGGRDLRPGLCAADRVHAPRQHRPAARRHRKRPAPLPPEEVRLRRQGQATRVS